MNRGLRIGSGGRFGTLGAFGVRGGGVADTTPPTVTITCAQTSPSATTPLNMTFTWSEAVTGFAITDIVVGDGTAGNFAGSGTTYTCDVTPTGIFVTVDVAQGVCVDGAGNANSAATQFTFRSLIGLVSYWKLDETSNGSAPVTRADSFGTNTLADINTMPSRTGKISNGMDADELGELTKADNADLSMGDIDFTFTCWANFDVLTANKGILGKWSSNNEYALAYGITANRFSFVVQNPSSTQTSAVANSLGAPATGTWYFIVCGHDSVNDKVFIQVNNGTVDTADHTGGVRDGGNAFNIGSYNGAARMDGIIDEVGLWKRVLSLTERTALYNGGAGLTYPF